MEYKSKINKSDLEHGVYYSGHCRNASEARWDATIQRFIYWRSKFGELFLEEICHPEDDQIYDVFVVESKKEVPIKEVPFNC